MKRSTKSGAGAKRAPATVDAYLSGLPAGARSAFGRLRATVRSAAPGAVELIRYGMPVYKLDGRMLVGFAAFAGHLSFYVMSPAVMRAHAVALAPYDTAKGTIRFPAAKPLPAALVRKLVRARVAELGRRRAS